jgi:hypothetical protein
MFGVAAALLAVALAAVSSQLWIDSLYARPEAFVLLCFAVALWATLRSASDRDRSTLWLALAGLCGGLMTGAKFSLVFTVAHLGLIAVALAAERGRTEIGARAHARRVTVVLAAALVGFFAGVPAALLDPSAYAHGVQFLLDQYARPHSPFGRPGSPWVERAGYALNQIVAEHGLPQLVLAALGAVLWMRARPLLAAAVVLPATLFIIRFCLGSVYFERNFSLYLPLVSGLCAYGIVRIACAVPRWRGTPTAVALALSAAAIIPPALMFRRIAIDVVPSQVARWEETFGREIAMSASHGLPVEGVPQLVTKEVAPAFAAKAAAQPPRIYRLFDLADPFSAEGVRTLVAEHGWSLIAQEPSPVADLRQPMLQLMHARAFRYVVPPGTVLASRAAFVGAADLCQDGAAVLPVEGGWADGMFPNVPTPSAVTAIRGTWRTHDSDVAVMRLGPFMPPPDSFLPIVTGPGAEGLAATIREARSGRVLARLPAMPLMRWIGWRLPSSAEPIEIEVRDEGRGYGQWIAIGTRLTRLRGQEVGAVFASAGTVCH